MNDRSATHPAPERLAAFGRHALNGVESATIEAHVAACDGCRRVLQALPEDPLLALVRESTPADCRQPPLRLHAGYEILEEVGHGGMGVVYKARQPGLARLVALKRIDGGRRPRPEVLARFRREAEAVARLDHPSIVRIYEVGEQDGQPYLALEYVAGGTLRERLAASPLRPDAAAALVETLAWGIAHAHEHGIVHRDLKPGNILLAVEGGGSRVESDRTLHPPPCTHPKITDFGLAKLLDQEAAQTQTGDIVGTPAYMAPEQARGQTRDVGPAADVYALGAILYEALTGRPPFQGATVLDTLDQVRTQEPVPPSRLQPKVPRDLDTVCLKCLQKAPRQRYASATALADDVRRFQDGKPILARPVAAWERTWKAARRRPAVTGLIALSMLAALALVGGLWLHTTSLDEQVRRAEAGESNARRQQARADTNYRQARKAINQILDRLGKFHAAGVPQVESLRRELNKEALTFFEEIAKADADPDPATRLDIAKAYRTIGAILTIQGQAETGRPHLDRARLLLEKLIAEDPGTRDYHAELSQCFEDLAQSAVAQRRNEEALGHRVKVKDIRQQLCRLEPGNPERQRALAVSHINLGVAYYGLHEAGDRTAGGKAQAHWQEAIRIQEKLVQHHPKDTAYQFQLAICYTNLALVFGSSGRKSEAEALYRKGAPILTVLVRDHPENKDWTQALAQSGWLWGALLCDLGRGEEARPLLDRAIDIVDTLVLEDPQRPSWQELLLNCLVARMSNSTLLDRRNEGEVDWQQGLRLAAQLKTWGPLCIGARWDARSGAHTLAAARAELLLKQPGLTSADRFELVRAYALAAQVALTDRQLAPSEQSLHADSHADAAVALLARLGKDGYFKDGVALGRLKAEEDLDLLRRRPDFQQLLATLETTCPTK